MNFKVMHLQALCVKFDQIEFSMAISVTISVQYVIIVPFVVHQIFVEKIVIEGLINLKATAFCQVCKGVGGHVILKWWGRGDIFKTRV